MSWQEKFKNFDFGFQVIGIVAIVCAAIAAWLFSDGSAAVWHVIEARFWIEAKAPNMPLWFSQHNTPAAEIVKNTRPEVWAAATRTVRLSPVVGVLCAAALALFFNIRGGGGGGAGKDKHLRGARLVPSWRLRARLMVERARDRLFRRAADKKPIEIGGLTIPYELESLHFLVSGTTGSGKTQTILPIMQAVRERGDRLICTDVGGNLMAAMAARGDRLLNPFDARSLAWSPFAEMNNAWDADRIAQSMIPAASGDSGEWHRYAQALVSAVLRRLWERGATTNERLLYWLTVAPPMPPEELPCDKNNLAALVAGLPAARLFTPGADRMLASTLGIVGTYMSAYQYLDPNAGSRGFSVRKWIEQEGSNWLWMPYADDQATTLRPLLAAWVDIAVSAILSLRPSFNRRVWAVMDELASLGRIGSISDALTKGRKYGLCCIAGIQSISQLREHYGRDGAETLLSCLSSLLVLRTPNAETADYLSRTLGEREVEREEESRGDRGSSVSARRDRTRVVLASEIQNLPPLTGYLSLAGDYQIALVKIPLTKPRERAKPFIPHKDAAPVSTNAVPDSVDPLAHLLSQTDQQQPGGEA